MAQYMHVKRCDVPATLNYISWAQTQAGTFHNVQVKPYRGKKYNPEKYVTIKIG